MTALQARKRAWQKEGAHPLPLPEPTEEELPEPGGDEVPAQSLPADTGEEARLCAWFERMAGEEEEGEGPGGCDWPDGPLSRQGCRW